MARIEEMAAEQQMLEKNEIAINNLKKKGAQLRQDEINAWNVQVQLEGQKEDEIAMRLYKNKIIGDRAESEKKQ